MKRSTERARRWPSMSAPCFAPPSFLQDRRLRRGEDAPEGGRRLVSDVVRIFLRCPERGIPDGGVLRGPRGQLSLALVLRRARHRGRAGIVNAMIALSLVWWPGYVRLVQGKTLTLRSEVFVE